jgi:LDH2 family malate/lactate/ureidoglycolate dehydrogenase
MGFSPRVDATRLTDFAAAVYANAGMPEADARLVADTLVQADLWGHQSHGVLRLGWYLDRLRHGVMHPVTTPEFVVDAGAIAVIDGHDGVGQVLAMRTTHEAITRAKAHGIGAVAVRHSNHFGTCLYYTRRIAAAGCVAMLTSNGGPARGLYRIMVTPQTDIGDRHCVLNGDLLVPHKNLVHYQS